MEQKLKKGEADIKIDFKTSTITVFKETLEVIKNPEFIEIKVNPKEKLLVLSPVMFGAPVLGHTKVNKKQVEKMQCFDMVASTIVYKLGELMGILDYKSQYLIHGKFSSSMDGIVFDLKDYVIVPKTKKGFDEKGKY